VFIVPLSPAGPYSLVAATDHSTHFYYGSESAKEILSEKRSTKKCPERQRIKEIEETLKEQHYEQGGKK